MLFRHDVQPPRLRVIRSGFEFLDRYDSRSRRRGGEAGAAEHHLRDAGVAAVRVLDGRCGLDVPRDQFAWCEQPPTLWAAGRRHAESHRGHGGLAWRAVAGN
jgi:hypothetical protein